MHGAKHASSHLSLVIRNGFTVFVIENTTTTTIRPFSPFIEVVFVVTYRGSLKPLRSLKSPLV